MSNTQELKDKLLYLLSVPKDNYRLRQKLIIILGDIKPDFSEEIVIKKLYEILKNTENIDINLYKDIIEELIELSTNDVRVAGFLQVLTHKITCSSIQ